MDGGEEERAVHCLGMYDSYQSILCGWREEERAVHCLGMYDSYQSILCGWGGGREGGSLIRHV